MGGVGAVRAWPARIVLPMTPLLTRTQLSQILGCSTRQLDRDRAAGLIPEPVTTPPKNPRWRAADIERWIAAGMPKRKPQ